LLKPEHNLDIPVVFCGSNAGEIESALSASYVALLSTGVKSRSIYLGYVPDEDMSGIYAESVLW